MIKSFESSYSLNEPIKFVCFTNSIDEPSSSSGVFSYQIVEIDNLLWPEATLQRYRIISEYIESVDSEAVSTFAYIDADMRVHRANRLVQEMSHASGMTFVQHPGYEKFSRFLLAPKLLVRKIALLALYGGYGTWETRQSSRAFVPRRSRKTYVCGGFWFGESGAFIERVKNLRAAVDQDSSQGIVAVWHDESHLNAQLQVTDQILPSSFCADLRFEIYPEVVVEAVDKGGLETR